MRYLLMTCFVVLLTSNGCNKAKEAMVAAKKAAGAAGDAISDTATKVKQDLTDKAGKAKELVDNDGSLKLSVGEEVDLPTCLGKFVPGIAGRRSILQLRTYTESNADGYPSAFLHIPVDGASITDIGNGPLEARVFLQDAKGAIWDNVDKPPITLKVVEHQDDQLKLEVSGGDLRNAQTGELVALSGSATVVMQ